MRKLVLEYISNSDSEVKRLQVTFGKIQMLLNENMNNWKKQMSFTSCQEQRLKGG